LAVQATAVCWATWGRTGCTDRTATTSLFADAPSVFAAAAQVGGDVVITHDALNTIRLQNVQLASLTPDNLSFI
jgi:hypothetical protein